MITDDPEPALVSDAMEAFVDDDFSTALELYTKLVSRHPAHVSGWVHRSAVRLKLGEPHEPLADADRALALDAKNAKAHLRRGMALFDLGKHRGASSAGGRWIRRRNSCATGSAGARPQA